MGIQYSAWGADLGKLDTDTTSAGTIGYVYDADGNLIIRRDPGQTTVFLEDEQITQDTSTGTLTATRFYTIGDTTIASRSSQAAGTITAPVNLIPDRQGTDQLAIDSNTYAVTRRQYLPFGQPRGTIPTAWPGGQGGVKVAN